MTNRDAEATPNRTSTDGGVAGGESAAEATPGESARGDATISLRPKLPFGGSVAAVALREYRLAVRSRWALGIALLFGLFTTAVVRFGTSAVGPGRVDAVVATVVELCVYLVPLVAFAVGYDAVVGADERGSLELLLSLPLSRGRVAVGMFLGRAAVLGGAVLLGFVPGGAVTALSLGVGAVGPYAVVALTASLAGCAILGVAVLVSTVAPTETHALGGSLALWLWFVLLHDLAALGAIAAFDLGGSAVAAAVLLNPVDCFRVVALSRVDVVAGGFGAVMARAGLTTWSAVAALAAWTVAPVALAARLLVRRRL